VEHQHGTITSFIRPAKSSRFSFAPEKFAGRFLLIPVRKGAIAAIGQIIFFSRHQFPSAEALGCTEKMTLVPVPGVL
jgi:hypothetical protein